MISSVLLLSGLASISLCVLSAVHADSPNGTFESETINLGEIPYQVILQNANTSLYFCGGFLIHTFYVLTAAECVIRRTAKDIIVHFGIINLNNRSVHTRTVHKILIHEQYIIPDVWRNNIALLRLHENLFPLYIALARLPTFDMKSEKESVASVSGYGITSEGREPASRQLLKRNIYTSPWQHCKNIFKIMHYDIANSQMCAYDPISFTQNRTSDVGGPLVVNQIVVGIASSMMIDVYNRPYPILFTNIWFYQRWIHLHVRIIH